MNLFRCCTHLFQGRKKTSKCVFSPRPLFLPRRYLSRASLSFFVRNTISVLYFAPVSLHFSRCGIKSRRSPPLPAKLSLWFLTLSALHILPPAYVTAHYHANFYLFLKCHFWLKLKKEKKKLQLCISVWTFKPAGGIPMLAIKAMPCWGWWKTFPITLSCHNGCCHKAPRRTQQPAS